MANLNDIKSWFRTGKFPTESQFSQTWDSFWHKAEKISLSAVEGLSQILSSKADRDLVDRQVEDLRTNKENVGVARDLVNTHNVAPDAHEALFALKANDADVYHRDVLDARFSSHEEDEEMHLQEGEREAWNAHKDDVTLHKTSEQIRSEIVEADIPSTIARDSEVDQKLSTHNTSELAHTDIRNTLESVVEGLSSYATQEWVNQQGYTQNTGTVTQVKVGSVAYDPVSGVISLPKYPEMPVLTGGAVATNGQYVSGVTVSGHSVSVTKATLPSVPSALKNPHAITFTGASEVSYDGSSAVTVNIPNKYLSEAKFLQGTAIGPVLNLTKADGSVSNTAIPSASSSASGVVTTVAQTFAGAKTFNSAVTSTAGFYDTSDKRLKENICLIDLQDKDIRLYEFDKQGRHAYGVIAQEMEELYPSTVIEGQDGYKTVNYNEILVIKCAEQDKKIRQLQSCLEIQADSVKQLQQKLTELEMQLIRQQK